MQLVLINGLIYYFTSQTSPSEINKVLSIYLFISLVSFNHLSSARPFFFFLINLLNR